MSASWFGHLEVVRLLLAHGARINKQNSLGTTALNLAVDSDNVELVRELLEQGADVTSKHWSSGNALDTARSRVLGPNCTMVSCKIFNLLQEHTRQPLTAAESFFSESETKKENQTKTMSSSNSTYQPGVFFPKTVRDIISDYANPFGPNVPNKNKLG
jgi:ankyrin repeat protein